ncbi:MAG: SDR family oxidoreductase [Candidatus Sericytochromatia bacterium]|nr:SDR family oxidoreductase [Candidatus Tanganyikabacteria bacterium]
MAQGTALVTGASAGIGEVFARGLARRNWDVVLVARRLDRLEAIAAALAETYQVRAEAIQADLADPAAVDQIAKRLAELDLRVDYLVNNAGFGISGAFATTEYQRIESMLRVNVDAVTRLTHSFLPGMLERRRGHILNVASMGGFQPVPYFSAYAATKAFVLSFTEGLSEELAGTGVTATVLCPGATSTEFNSVAGVDGEMFKFAYQTPEEVVDTALVAVERGEVTVIPGALNALQYASSRLAPRGLTRKLAGFIYSRVMRPHGPT